MDIDEQYNLGVKSLYSDIIDYISRAQVSMTPTQTEDLFTLRAAGKDLVDAIKGTKHLQKNLDLYRGSANPEIVREYNTIRLELASVLRALEEVRRQGDDSAAILSLDELKMEVKTNDKQLLGRLDKLVRKNLISPQMATSLINDSSYAYRVTKRLVKMGEALFSSSHSAVRSAERSLALDADELDEMISESESTIGEPQ